MRMLGDIEDPIIKLKTIKNYCQNRRKLWEKTEFKEK